LTNCIQRAVTTPLAIGPFLHPQNLFIFIYKKKYGQYENFEIILVELKKIGTLWGCFAKIETLVFKFKNVVSFGGINCNFSLLLLQILFIYFVFKKLKNKRKVGLKLCFIMPLKLILHAFQGFR
jgi:hypothetical protein